MQVSPAVQPRGCFYTAPTTHFLGEVHSYETNNKELGGQGGVKQPLPLLHMQCVPHPHKHYLEPVKCY